jgi:thiol-disulfide isomerase/thioredoxin
MRAFLAFLGLQFIASPVFGTGPGGADVAWARVEAVREQRPTGAAIPAALIDFAEQYPADARALPAALDAASHRSPGARGSPERDAWNRRLATVLERVVERAPSRADPSVPRALGRRAVALMDLDPELGWKAAQPLLARQPDADELWHLAKSYYRRRAWVGDSADTWLRETAAQQSKAGEWARKQLALQQLRTEPLEWSFTAVDGRAVDVTQFRGKVVLIDYWATWCPPCVAEMPMILQFYRDHRDKGLEIIGVSVDVESTREQFFTFVAQHQLPWPQHCDFLGGATPPAARFGIDSFPFILLLGRDGRLVTTSAGGDFEHSILPELRRLLNVDGAPGKASD